MRTGVGLALIDVPVLSGGAGSDIPTTIFAKTSTSTVPNPTTVAQNNAAFRWNSIDPRQNVATSGFFGNSNYLGEHATIETVVPGSAIDLQILAFTAAFDVLVNGKYINTAGFTNDASGLPMLLTLNWSTRGPRNLKIIGFNLAFAGAFISNTDSLSAPTYTRPPLVFFPGDSYTQGNGAASPARTWANYLAAAMGWEAVQSGIGGTGWVSSGSSLPATRVANDLALRTHAPDRIRPALGYNDDGSDMVLLQSQMIAALEAMLADFPSAVREVQGPWTPLGETPSLATVKKKMMQVCAGEGVAFGDISQIITAANAALYTGPDNVHPTALGHQYLGQQIALVAFSVPIISTAWNLSDKTSTLDLSNGAQVATVNANTGDPQARSTKSRSSGKAHFELAVNLAGGSYEGSIGLASASHPFSTYLGGDAFSIGVWLSATNTEVIINNTIVYQAGPNALNKGEVFAIEVDFDAKLFWFQDATAGAPWNNNPSANPATGAGGVDISSLSGPFFICAENDTTGDATRLNTVASAFEGVVSSGFSGF